MSFYNKFERKFKKYEITRFWRVIVLIAIIGAFVGYMMPDNFYSHYLSLNPELILKGQIWRIATFLFQPRQGILYLLLEIYFFYWLGETLESVWGAFKFNLFYYTGILSYIVTSLLLYIIFGINTSLSLSYLNMAMFLSFVTIFPNNRVLIMFIIPVKTKWIGIIDGVILAVTIIKGFMPVQIMKYLPSSYYQPYLKSYYLNNAISALIAVIIYYLFTIKMDKKNNTTFNNRTFSRVKIKVHNNKSGESPLRKKETIHKCYECGRTNKTNPELEFRYCSKCTGHHEYCIDHIYTHTHK